MPFHIVLVEPEIPQNTGNIARTCAATGSVLHLVKPLGFSLEDRYLKRAGLDYWDKLDVRIHENYDDFALTAGTAACYYLTTKAEQAYSRIAFSDGDYLIFGRETRGLPMPLLSRNWDRAFRIPMRDSLRSLNLSNAVAIVLYEALRQSNFTNLL